MIKSRKNVGNKPKPASPENKQPLTSKPPEEKKKVESPSAKKPAPIVAKKEEKPVQKKEIVDMGEPEFGDANNADNNQKEEGMTNFLCAKPAAERKLNNSEEEEIPLEKNISDDIDAKKVVEKDLNNSKEQEENPPEVSISGQLGAKKAYEKELKSSKGKREKEENLPEDSISGAIGAKKVLAKELGHSEGKQEREDNLPEDSISGAIGAKKVLAKELNSSKGKQEQKVNPEEPEEQEEPEKKVEDSLYNNANSMVNPSASAYYVRPELPVNDPIAPEHVASPQEWESYIKELTKIRDSKLKRRRELEESINRCEADIKKIEFKSTQQLHEDVAEKLMQLTKRLGEKYKQKLQDIKESTVLT